jgi:peroxiredoxin
MSYSQQSGQVLHQKTQKSLLTEESIVKDTSGTIYRAEIWRKLLLTGYYNLKPENANDKNTAFILIRISEEERAKRLSNSSKPKESKCFVTGEEVQNFSTTDINDNNYKLNDLKGKVVVVNFWFIDCKPCRLEIFELNKLVQDYKDSSNIVFLAIALDSKNDLKKFLKKNPFNYTIIENGQSIATMYNVTAYPTHVVIDQEGKAYFHTTGLGSTTAYWLKKSIEELMVSKN